MEPGLARAIVTGTPRNISGPLLLDGHNRLYIGSPHPRKRKQLSESEREEASDSESSGSEEHDESPSRKGKGVKRARRLGDGFGEGMGGGGTVDGAGDGASAAHGSGEVLVKTEDTGECHGLIGREEPFTTKDGKQVTLINLTDDSE